MKIYQLWWSNEDGCATSWHPSLAAAKRARRDLEAEEGVTKEETMIILRDIPSDKSGLLRWLNRHYRTENG